MKKLPITKEAFEKSRYFKNKYGTLKCVSESGKLFKTNKGRILKFKESFNKDDYDDRDENERPKYDIGEAVNLTPDFFNSSDSLMEGIAETGWIVEDVREGRYGWEYYIVHDNPWDKDDDDDADHSDAYWVDDDEIEKAGKSRRRRVRESKKFGRKFSESGKGIANDPAYECPFCGSHDTEFEDCPEIGTQDGYFDGAKFNATWYCNECGRHYNVEFTMNVTDVTPMANDMDDENLEIELPGSELEDEDL